MVYALLYLPYPDFTGIPQVIVLTKVDEACQMVREDLRKLYHSRKIKEKVISVCNPTMKHIKFIFTCFTSELGIMKYINQICCLAMLNTSMTDLIIQTWEVIKAVLTVSSIKNETKQNKTKKKHGYL